MKIIAPIVLALIVAGVWITRGDNTEYPHGFSREAFDGIKNGMTRAQVTRALGSPFEVYSYIDFGADNGSNNYPGERTEKDFPTAESISLTLVYSRPKARYSDYLVFEVFIDPDTNRVSGKQTYKTD